MPLLGIAVTNSARAAGHAISFALTGVMMIGISVYTYRSSRRRWGTHWSKYGPTYLTIFAGIFIMMDLTRHVLQDSNVWPENTRFSGWETAGQIKASGYSEFRSVDALKLVNLFDKSNNVLSFNKFNSTASITFDALKSMRFSMLEIYGGNSSMWRIDCADDLAGPWSFVTNTSSLNTGWTEVPMDPVGKGDHRFWRFNMLSIAKETTATFGFFKFSYRATWSSQQYNWGCHIENFGCLSPLGWLFTVFFTYFGFALLIFGSLWNAKFLDKMAELKDSWRELRRTDYKNNVVTSAKGPLV